MNDIFIYYHRLHFPSESGQTIQVLRDYHYLSKINTPVHLFYRSQKSFPMEKMNQLLHEYNITPNENFNMHCIANGWFGKLRLTIETIRLIKSAENSRFFLVVRTLTHAKKALLLRTIFKKTKIKILIELHETAFPHIIFKESGDTFKSKLSMIKEKIIFKKVDGIICTIQPQCDLLERFFPKHAPVAVFPNGILPELISNKETQVKIKTNDKFILRYAGQFNQWKNIDILIEALQYLPSFTILEIAGGKKHNFEETLHKLNELAMKFGVASRVKYIGVLAPSEVHGFLSGANVLLLPLGDNVQSRYFTSPMKLFEYAGSGVPMVVTKHPTTLSLIKDGEQALMVEPCSAKAMASAVNILINNPALCQTIASNALNWVKQYTYDNRTKNYHHFIRNL